MNDKITGVLALEVPYMIFRGEERCVLVMHIMRMCMRSSLRRVTSGLSVEVERP
jgi:hypothetical protein